VWSDQFTSGEQKDKQPLLKPSWSALSNVPKPSKQVLNQRSSVESFFSIIFSVRASVCIGKVQQNNCPISHFFTVLLDGLKEGFEIYLMSAANRPLQSDCVIQN
jgi:hypothetical protein